MDGFGHALSSQRKKETRFSSLFNVDDGANGSPIIRLLDDRLNVLRLENVFELSDCCPV